MTKHKRNAGNGATTVSIKPPPMRPSVIESEVAVPLLWSVLLAGSLGLVATLVAAALRVVFDAHWDWQLVLSVGGCVGVLVFAWRVITCENDRRALLLWPLEAVLGQDLDGDSYIGEPQVEVEPVEPDPRLIFVHGGQNRANGQADFRFWLREVYGAGDATWRRWDDHLLPSGRRISRTLWQSWSERLLHAKLAERPYTTAPLQLVGTYREALVSLREVL